MTIKVKKLLAQNSKLKKDGIWQFDIPAYQSRTGLITCPMAKDCIANCYARMGTYMFPVVREKHEWNLEQTLRDDFSSKMIEEIKSKKVCKIVRLHSSGDIYSREYLHKWLKVVESCPNTLFYAYTKSFHLLKGITLPSNFKVIQSYGGKLPVDETKQHAKVYSSVEAMPANYSNASDSDLVAINNINVGLIYHGTKKMTDNGFITK